MSRLSHWVAGEWVEHSHPPVFRAREIVGQTARVVAAVPQSDPLILQRMADCLTPPFHLLYVLHTPIGDGKAGRYQSPPLSNADLHGFLDRFNAFLRSDARHDLWALAPGSQATVIWDRHNLIYAYGPLSLFAQALLELGFREGEPEIPSPHAHNYCSGVADDEAAVLASFEWRWSPLRPEDEQ